MFLGTRLSSLLRGGHGSTWVHIGSGAWDRQGRDSQVRADRLPRMPAAAARWEGSRSAEQRVARAAEVVRDVHGWDG